MRTTENLTDDLTAYFRTIIRNQADMISSEPIDSPSWETLHALRHTLAARFGCDPMAIDIYNVRDRTGAYVGGFDAYDGCAKCKWDQSRY